MAKAVTNAAQFRDPFQPSYGPDRNIFVVKCDDGGVYEFQKLEDEPVWDMRSRGSVDENPRYWSQSRAKLPADVVETLNSVFGEDFWTK